MNIILASGSPRRRELLERMGLRSFRVMSPDVDENIGTFPPSELVSRLSARKARAVLEQVSGDDLVIAADTVVARDGVILGKPGTPERAVEMLAALSGGSHQVYTGVTVARGDEICTEYEMTEVRFRPLSPEEIEDYVRTGEPLDKAGAYGIQGLGALFIQGIRGDYYNVMGLPVCRLSAMLEDFGVRCMHLAAGRC